MYNIFQINIIGSEMFYRSEYHKALKPNITNDLYGRALEKGDCIFLTGSCPTPTPETVYKQLFKTFEKNDKFCSYNTGDAALKVQILNYMREHNEIKADPKKNLLITLGATTFLQQLFLYLLDENSECLVITPTFQDYFNQIRFTRSDIIEIPMLEESSKWHLEPKKVERAITDKTRLILLCSPNNPTGKIYTKEELTQLGRIAKKNNILLVADEAYNYLTYEKEFTSLLNIPEIKDNIVVVRTFSKEFSMCGWRIGYSYLPKNVYHDMFHLQLSFNSVSAAISQKAAEISLRESSVRKFAAKEIDRIRKNRDFVYEKLKKIEKDLEFTKPDACPYFYVKYNKDISSYELCKDMIDKCSVIVSPGSNNGKGGEKHFCITFADHLDTVEEGLNRITEYFRKYY